MKKLEKFIDEIIKMYSIDIISAHEISEKFGCCQNSILKILRENGICKNRQSKYWTDERRQYHSKLGKDGVIGIHLSRKNCLTSIELLFAKWAEDNNINIVGQFQFVKGTHRYDFRITGTNVLIEMDGEYWHSSEKQKRKDYLQEQYANSLGFVVLRFLDIEIDKNLNCFNRLFTVIASSDDNVSNIVDGDFFNIDIIRNIRKKQPRDKKPRPKHTLETREKMRKSSKLNAPKTSERFKGKQKSEEHREKISAALRGRSKTSDVVERMVETRRKLRRDRFGNKDIEKIDPISKKIIDRYVHISDCGIPCYYNIFSAINTNNTRYGYLWRTAND